jgi:mRNA-degrading endonuclease YafQ of YafQ-DinJ toxin-antitoxin module
MNLTPVYTTAFKKDFKRLEKRGADLEKLRRVIIQLLAGTPLAE